MDYTVPPPYRYRDGEDLLIISGFKWKGVAYVAAQPGVSTGVKPELIEEVDLLQEMYFLVAIRMALAEVVASEDNLIPGVVRFYATYPLAFSEERRERLRDVYDKVLRQLSRETGLSLYFSGMFDESQAGERGTQDVEKEVRPGPEVVTMDVGGGTTDFAAVTRQPESRCIFADSVRYAADDYLLSLTEARQTLTDRSVTRLHRDVLKAGVSSAFRSLDTFRLDNAKRVSALRGVQRYMAGTLELTARLIAARLQAPEVNEITVLLLGNGWRLASALLDAEGSEFEAVCKFARAEVMRILEMQYLPSGIIPRVPTLSFFYPEAAKEVVSKGALLLAMAIPQGPIPQEGVQEAGPRGFLGSTLHISDQAGRWVEVQWTQPLPVRVQDFALKAWLYITCRSDNFDFEKQTVLEQNNRERSIDSIELIKHGLVSEKRKQIETNVLGFILNKFYSRSFFLDPKQSHRPGSA